MIIDGVKMVKNGFRYNGRQRWQPARPRRKRNDTVSLRIKEIVDKKGPIHLREIEFEYVAKYGPIKIRVLYTELSELKLNSQVKRLKQGFYARNNYEPRPHNELRQETQGDNSRSGIAML